ncbi:MAG: helix-hairpin-helix domain-containing protein [bacterium]|nr:helix-hairpin-helix domain-containing protein [bacterium]
MALLLLQITYLLYLQGKKRTAYQRVAFNLQKQPYDLVTLAEEDRLSEIPGVGKVISSLIKEIVIQRRCRYYTITPQHLRCPRECYDCGL